MEVTIPFRLRGGDGAVQVEELGTRTSIERFFGRVLVLLRVHRPPVAGGTATETRVVLTSAAVWVIALTGRLAGRPDLIRSPRPVLAHVREGGEP